MLKRHCASLFQPLVRILFTKLQHGKRRVDALLERDVAFENTVDNLQRLLAYGSSPLTDGMLIPFRFLKTLRNILRVGVVSVADVTWKPLVRGNALMTAVNLNNAVSNFQINPDLHTAPKR